MMDVKKITKYMLLIPLLSVGFNVYAEDCNNISVYKSGCDKVKDKSKGLADCKRRAREECLWRQKNDINHVIVTGRQSPRPQSRHAIRVETNKHKKENQQVAMLGAGKIWYNFYKDLVIDLIFATPPKITDNCRQNASVVQTFRENAVWRLYETGRLNKEDDIEAVVQWKNGAGTYKYIESVSSIRVMETGFKQDNKGKGCKAIKNKTNPTTYASNQNRYTSRYTSRYRSRSARYYRTR